MNDAKKTTIKRLGRARRIKSRLRLDANRPRLIVDRSNKAIYAQIIDEAGKVLASANSRKMSDKKPIEQAKAVGAEVAQKALDNKIKQVAFDRKHYRYHGRVKALAEAAREKGLSF